MKHPKKMKLSIMALIAFNVSRLFAQNILLQENFTTYAGTDVTSNHAWYISHHGNYTTATAAGLSGPNSYKFPANNATVITPSFMAGTDTLSFWLKGYGTDVMSHLKIYESSDSLTWALSDSLSPLPTTGVPKKYRLNKTTRWLKFLYVKSLGNLAFDDFKITQYQTTVANFKDSSVCEGFCTPFTNLSQSTNSPLKKWRWNFGDGQTDTIKNPCHLYTTSGTYTVTLRCTDGLGLMDSITKTIHVFAAPPLPNINSGNACLGARNCFSVSNAPTACNYAWDMGDASVSVMEKPCHFYAQAGTYTVCCKVTNSQQCSKSNCTSVQVLALPTATFSSSNCNGTSICFDATASTNASIWLWAFGDGVNSNQQNPQHTYTNTGTFNACLKISNQDGCKDSICETITILTTNLYQKTEQSKFNISLIDDELTIQFYELGQKNKIELINLVGQKIISVETTEPTYKLNLTNENHALIVVKLTNEHSSYTRKILIQ